MTQQQRAALGTNPVITHITMDEDNIDAIKPLININDIVCMVGSPHMKRKFLELCPDKPVLVALNKRIPTGTYSSLNEPEFKYDFIKWQVLQQVHFDVVDYDPSNPFRTYREKNKRDLDIANREPKTIMTRPDSELGKLDPDLDDVKRLKYYAKLKGRRLINRITWNTKEYLDPTEHSKFVAMVENQFEQYMKEINGYDRINPDSK